MATNYDEELKRGQATFGTTPSGTSGANAFRAAYERIKSETANQRAGVEQSYADAYQQMRGGQYQEGLGAASLNAGMSGGQRAVANSKIGAQQAVALGSLMSQGRSALRDVDTQGQAAYSNALTEGQQAQQYAQQQEASAFERQKLITDVVKATGDYSAYTKEQRVALLKQLGVSEVEAKRLVNITANTAAQSYAANDTYALTGVDPNDPYGMAWRNG